VTEESLLTEERLWPTKNGGRCSIA